MPSDPNINKSATSLLAKSRRIDEGFNELILANAAQVRYVFRRLNEERYGPKELDWSRASVEHIFPQNPGTDWLTKSSIAKADISEYLQRVGNLTLLDRGLNTAASNNSFGDKQTEYKKSAFQLTRELLNFSEWTLTEIEEREEDLGKIAQSAWSL